MARIGKLEGFSPKYFAPSFRPRLKPKIGGGITPTGITATRIKPRIMPTGPGSQLVKPPRIKGIASGAKGLSGGIRKPSLSHMQTASSSGRPPRAAMGSGTSSSTKGTGTPRTSRPPRRTVKAPSSGAAQRPSMGLHNHLFGNPVKRARMPKIKL